MVCKVQRLLTAILFAVYDYNLPTLAKLTIYNVVTMCANSNQTTPSPGWLTEDTSKGHNVPTCQDTLQPFLFEVR